METYKLKYVPFLGREVPIVLQSENGPCPLLAIANVLLLRNAIRVPANTYEIEQDKLMAILAEYLLDNNPVEASSDYAANLQQNLEDVISNMHKLTTGVDVNPKFSSVRGFEFTDETAIFDLFDISLVHGWIMDPEEDVAASVGEMSYNQVVGKLISKLGAASLRHFHVPEAPLIDLDTEAKAQETYPVKCKLVFGDDGLELKLKFEQGQTDQAKEEKPEPSTSEVPAEVDSLEVKKWEAVRDWMDGNSSQLSSYGLYKLHQQLPEKELAVFFRNNHFNTIFKQKRSLFILVTDQGYLSESNLVWEKLESVNNDNQFYNGSFKPFEKPAEPPAPPPATDHDLQYALAVSMSLQQNEPPTNSLLPSDFLSLAHSQPVRNQHDSDFALAVQLQEEENLRSAQFEANQQAQMNNPRGPAWGRGQQQSHRGYHHMAGRQAPSTAAQHAFPPAAGYGSAPPDGQTVQRPLPVSRSGEIAPPNTLWGRFKKFWSPR